LKDWSNSAHTGLPPGEWLGEKWHFHLGNTLDTTAVTASKKSGCPL
jgi:hypothetical protein